MGVFRMDLGAKAFNGESIAIDYEVHRDTIDRILHNRLRTILAAMKSWPRFAKHYEDFALRSPDWVKKYEDRRVMIFWDDTNIDAPDPSDPDVNSALFSHYYYGGCKRGRLSSALWVDGCLGTLGRLYLRYRRPDTCWGL